MVVENECQSGESTGLEGVYEGGKQRKMTFFEAHPKDRFDLASQVSYCKVFPVGQGPWVQFQMKLYFMMNQ